jgi:alkylhydroperoxidase family enzyme
MATENPRIPPLPMSEWGELEKDALSVFVKDDGKRLQGSDDNKNKDMSGLALWLNHPALAKAIFTLTRHLLHDNVLPARDRELLVLRVAWQRKSEYEWAQHIIIAQILGMAVAEIERVSQAADCPEWSDKDKLLMAAVDELLASAVVSDATWAGLEKYYDKQQLMEVVVTVGSYDLMAMAFKSFGLPGSEEIQAVLAQFPMDERL